MGAYLSEPMKTTENEDGAGNKLRFGASTMQGWRASQEDAHNCVAQFDDKSSLYGVYDGHGGAEVAIYVAKHFPDLLKRTEAYLDGDIEKAFIEAYLKMDANIKEPDVLKEIRRLAKLADGEDENEAAADYEEDNVAELYEEATMPLDKLVAKYQTGIPVPDGANEDNNTEEKPCSSSKIFAAEGSSSSPSRSSPRLLASPLKTESSSIGSSGSNPETQPGSETASAVIADGNISSEHSEPKPSSTNGVSNGNAVKDEKDSAADLVPECSTEEKTLPGGIAISESSHCNGNGVGSVNEESTTEIENKYSVEEGGEVAVTPKKKGKVHPVPIVVTDIADKSKSPKREASRKATLAGLMAFSAGDDSSDFDSSDSDVQAPAKSGSDDDSEDDDSSESGDEEDSDDSEEEEDDSFLNGVQEPGFDSGTTAVVSFFRWEDDKLNLWVANAGDSRCVVSRKGTAIDMSFDHKPESEEETLRIVKAGGKVTDDGRVNGGLNLSRALGDHTYKQNETLAPEEQMISPLPNVKHLELNPAEDDEFVVLACDGVWNSMSSQEVVDFVKERIVTSPSLSKICEELFEHCLAEDTCGDGTGCDNMTAIIVQLSKPSAKRTMDDVAECDTPQEPTKRAKLDTETETD